MLHASDDVAPAPEPEREPAVLVEDVWVRFRNFYHARGGLKGALARTAKQRRTRGYVEALRGVSFAVPHGAVYGVIGRNGAGKSTLFRTIAGILPPTEGRIATWGRVTPLLSLGLGFNRELTGRENILLGGLANGLQPEEIHDAYDAIIRFADLGAAIDYPMRTYSSGMFGRLGFSVAVHLKPEILLIDEALSAGDASFKKKSIEKIAALISDDDCTVMLVSHGLDLVKLLATRTLWIDRGQVVMEGPSPDVVDAYLSSQDIEEEAAVMEDV